MKSDSNSFNYIKLRLRLCISIILLSILSPALTQAADPLTEEWHYTLRPNDNLQKVSQGFLNRQHTWTDLIRHNQIENVSALAPGSIIRIPMHWLKHQPQPAKAKSLTGSVQIKRASKTQFKVMKQGMQIRVGDEIATRNGNLLIEFADGSTVRLEENSSLVFNKLSHFGKTGMVDTRLRLKRGSLSTEVSPLVKGSRYEITTPSAVAAVRGTKFRLLTEGQETKLEVVEGTVNFSNAHGSATVTEGHGARIKQNSTTIQQNRLPAAPKPQFADKVIDDLPSTLSWEKQQNAKAYSLQVTDKNKQEKLVKKAKSKQPEVQLEHIQNGDYNLSMRAINQQGYEGIDAVSSISVKIASETPELLAPLDRSILDTNEPKFIWKFKKSGVLGKLEIAQDAEFENQVIKHDFDSENEVKLSKALLPGKYFWRVASLADDSQRSTSLVREFSLKGSLAQIKILSVNYVESQVGLFWNKLKNTKGYILQISESKDFENILKEQTLGKARAHLRLNPGKQYYARVKGIESDLFTSEFGPAKALYIEVNKSE